MSEIIITAGYYKSATDDTATVTYLVDGVPAGRTVSYCPTDPQKSYRVLKEAQLAGTCAVLAEVTLSRPVEPPESNVLPQLITQFCDNVESKTQLLFKNGFNVTVGGTPYLVDAASGVRAGLNWTDLGLLAVTDAVVKLIAELGTLLTGSGFPTEVKAKINGLASVMSATGTFPRTVETMVPNTSITIPTFADAIQFVLQLKMAVQSVTTIGSSLKAQAMLATTREELEAIIDTRS